jgi:hypothetical protein
MTSGAHRVAPRRRLGRRATPSTGSSGKSCYTAAQYASASFAERADSAQRNNSVRLRAVSRCFGRPTFTQLALFARLDEAGDLHLINHLRIELGSDTETYSSRWKAERLAGTFSASSRPCRSRATTCIVSHPTLPKNTARTPFLPYTTSALIVCR